MATFLITCSVLSNVSEGPRDDNEANKTLYQPHFMETYHFDYFTSSIDKKHGMDLQELQKCDHKCICCGSYRPR